MITQGIGLTDICSPYFVCFHCFRSYPFTEQKKVDENILEEKQMLTNAGSKKHI
jgi:hypothetical protein